MAALRPPRGTWDLFVDQLKRLHDSGELSSDEVTAIVASAFTDRALSNEVLEDDVDASSISEVVERVNAAHRDEADTRVAQAELAAEESGKAALSLRMNIERRARGIARIVCWSAAFLGRIGTGVRLRCHYCGDGKKKQLGRTSALGTCRDLHFGWFDERIERVQP